jgi:heme exporter protein D
MIGAPGAALKRPAVTNIGAFLAMGGYAVFVWPAYGLTLVVLGGLALHSGRRYRQSVRTLEQLQRQIETR